MNAKNAVRVCISKHLQEACSFTQRLRASIHDERKLSAAIDHAVSFELLLGLAYPGNFR